MGNSSPADSPVLGVVIPARNAASTIGHTLASLSLVSTSIDVVVVDGESTDATLDIARAFGISTISRPPLGIYDAVNHGIRALSTPWVTYINADDILYGDCLLARLTSCGDADILYGSVDFVDVMGRFLHNWQSARPHLLLSLFRAGYSPLLQQGTLFRREVFDSLDGFDTSWQLVADADFWFRALLKKFRFHYESPRSVAAFRMHRNQLSRRLAAKSLREHRAMIERHGRGERLMGSFTSLLWRASNWKSYAARLGRRSQGMSAYACPSSFGIDE